MRCTKILAARFIAVLLIVAPAGTAHGETYAVRMKFNKDTGELYFEPGKLEIHPGDTVVWIQDDPLNEHSVVAYPDKIPAGTEPFASPLSKMPGETWSHTFTEAGSYYYHCHPHEAAGMRGVVIVGRRSLPREFRRPNSGEMEHDHSGDDGGGHDLSRDRAMKGDHMMEDGTMMEDVDMTNDEVMKKRGVMKRTKDDLHQPMKNDGYYGANHHFD